MLARKAVHARILLILLPELLAAKSWIHIIALGGRVKTALSGEGPSISINQPFDMNM
jgi:hypothetical protein